MFILLQEASDSAISKKHKTQQNGDLRIKVKAWNGT